MPFAVTHVLVPIIFADLIRDHVLKNPKILTNKFVFAAGIGGLVLDLDLILYNFLAAVGIDLGIATVGHRIIFHNIWMPLCFFGFFALFYFLLKQKKFGKIFLMLFVGAALHLLLDATLTGNVLPLFPFSTAEINWNLVGLTGSAFGTNPITILISMDALLLLFWLYHEEMEHKISDYF